MASRPHPAPVVPDHVMLRRIGGGAYGEVWLGQGVTGALRAVKVVWREDFEDERGFEREFEGILKFEPISRDHPGLVNILHVGRGSGDGGAFYFYVMELGDDIRNGREIDPVEYEPRTLRSDARGSVATRMELAECLDVGLRLAEALDHLHGQGLAHRDVKPSNVIFVNGRAKLADIGLVAARGQRTFVGTEGFVPPEGPGSAQADVYSLGKVLYEIATGKDRLDFPELPDDLPGGPGLKRWLALNHVICEVCEPRVSKRRIVTAAGLAEALRRLQSGRLRHRAWTGRAVWAASLLLLGVSVWAGVMLWRDGRIALPLVGNGPPPPVPKVVVEVVTTPGGADVYDENGRLLGITPLEIPATAGGDLRLTLKRANYRTKELSKATDGDLARALEAPVSRESRTVHYSLEVYRPPETGEEWLDPFGNSYQPVAGGHIGFSLVGEVDWKRFLEATKRPAGTGETVTVTQNGEPSRVVACSPEEAAAYCSWLRAAAIKAGYLTDDFEVLPVMETAPGGAQAGDRGPFRVQVRAIDYATLTVTSNPPGAEVYVNGVLAGKTNGPLAIQKVLPGATGIILIREGFKNHTDNVGLSPGQKMALEVKMTPSNGARFDRPWTNGLGMKFVPRNGALVSVWETRVRDFAVFVKESGHPPPPEPAFAQTPDDPVVFVSRSDAVAFCEWLTKRERGEKEGRLAPFQEYRLPTDLEWSALAGADDSADASPKTRAYHKAAMFPWGIQWPPPGRTANLADSTAVSAGMVPVDRAIEGYTDGFAATAPVGSFPPSASGLYDLSGNAAEWMADDYAPSDLNGLGVLRGGSWYTFTREHLFTGARDPQPPAGMADTNGFRVVLARVPVIPHEEPTD